MTKTYYLAYYINRFNIDDVTCFILMDDLEVKKIELENISKIDTLITYNAENLIPYFQKRSLKLPKKIIDITQVKKLLVGQSSNYLKYIPWDFLNMLREETFLQEVESYTLLMNQEIKLNNDEIQSLLVSIGKKCKAIWQKMILELEEKDEKNRYFDIELPLAQILYDRQYLGINIDQDKLVNRLICLDDYIYGAQKELIEEWKIRFPMDKLQINKKFLELEIIHCDLLSVENYFTNAVFKSAAMFHPFSKSLYKHLSSKRDKQFLLGIGAIDEKRIYPKFDGIGTVTGRILVKTPLIQLLRKESRSLIKHDLDNSLLYIDYGQFEPGILAALSNDTNLIDLYNNDDVYNELGRYLLPDEVQIEKRRDVSKVVFMAYINGMKRENLTQYILASTNSEIKGEKLEKNLNDFFDKYPEIEIYKSKIYNDFMQNSKIGSELGNYRYASLSTREDQNSIHIYEKNWLLNQKVQGTSSLIVKQAIVDTMLTIVDVDFLIPMHDAVLFQVPTRSYDDIKDKIELVFKQAFNKYCGNRISPKVHIENFSDTRTVQ